VCLTSTLSHRGCILVWRILHLKHFQCVSKQLCRMVDVILRQNIRALALLPTDTGFVCALLAQYEVNFYYPSWQNEKWLKFRLDGGMECVDYLQNNTKNLASLYCHSSHFDGSTAWTELFQGTNSNFWMKLPYSPNIHPRPPLYTPLQNSPPLEHG
jgi:hypothetical protein